MKTAKKIATLILFILLLGSCTYKNAFNGPGYIGGYEIEIGTYGDYCVTESTVIECSNPDKLQNIIDREISRNPVYIYFDPEEKMSEIVKLFGFEGEEYSSFMETERYYKSGDKTLRVDDYGCFTFNLGETSERLEMPYTPKECLTIAKNYMREKNLLPENVASEWSVNEMSNTAYGTTVITEYGINIYRGKLDGRDVTGNSRITIEINGDGNVSQITYNWREYRSKERAELIPVSEALEKVYSKDARFEVKNPASKLTIKGVELFYYELARDHDNLAIQPIYVFTGTSRTTDGKTEDFAVMVQANRIK